MIKCKSIRYFDIFFSSLGIFIFSPLFIIVTTVLLLTGEGKVFYKQMRLGLNKEKFYVFKFVTMLEKSAHMKGGSLTVFNDHRILPFGRFLRDTKINELPQLFNVLLGEMSLIGPRPLTKKAFDSYSKDVKDIVSSVKPGLSGVGSIIFRNEEKMLKDGISQNFFYNKLMPYKGDLEVWYVNNQSLYLYFKLIFLTIFVVFIPKSKLPNYLLKDAPEPNKDILSFFRLY